MNKTIILLQTQEAIEQGTELLKVGENASVTTIGVMAVLCVILLGFTIAMWRSKNKTDKEHTQQQLNFLESITTANIILKDVQTESKAQNVSLNEVKSLLAEMKGFIIAQKDK